MEKGLTASVHLGDFLTGDLSSPLLFRTQKEGGTMMTMTTTPQPQPHDHSTPNRCHEQLLTRWKGGAMGGGQRREGGEDNNKEGEGP